MNGSEHGYGGISYYDPDVVVWVGEPLGQHTGPGEVFIIPDIGGNNNMSQAYLTKTFNFRYYFICPLYQLAR